MFSVLDHVLIDEEDSLSNYGEVMIKQSEKHEHRVNYWDVPMGMTCR